MNVLPARLPRRQGTLSPRAIFSSDARMRRPVVAPGASRPCTDQERLCAFRARRTASPVRAGARSSGGEVDSRTRRACKSVKRSYSTNRCPLGHDERS
jgi:hypothetical protein